MDNRKEELKELFYTELTANQIKKKMNISSGEYRRLLSEVKEDLGLPTNYRRLPKNFKLYGENKYYIGIEYTDGTFEILEYAPLLEIANQKLINYESTDKSNKYFIGQATKEHMLKNIEEDYFNKEMKWDMIMLKYKLSYHDFYELLNVVKEKRSVNGSRTASRLRYIVPKSHGVWLIRKTVKGVTRNYGAFRSLEQTIRLRDYLESIDWDFDEWSCNKEVIEDNIL